MTGDAADQLPTRIAALPCWRSRDVAVVPLKGGLSNESYLVTDKGTKFVVRFGQDFPFHHVFREREAMTARAAHAAGFAPRVAYWQPGVMVSEFIEATTYQAADVRKNADTVAALIGRFHREMPLHVRGAPYLFLVHHVIRDYAATLREAGSAWAPRLGEYLALAAELDAEQVLLPIVFGHNDLLPANFLDDGSRLWLIDFEYAGFSSAMFDLAGAASNASMAADESAAFLARYFDRNPEPALLGAHSAMQCASLLREAMWAMVSEIHLNAPGVDYGGYARENLDKLAAALARHRGKYGKHAS